MPNFTNPNSPFNRIPHTPRAHSRNRLALLLGLLALLLPAALVAVSPQRASAQTRSFHWDRYDSDITVNQDGSLDVVETLVYVYDSGDFHRGNRAIPLGRVESITGVQVDEEQGGQLAPYRETNYDPDESTSGVPGTFGTLSTGSELKIRWVYDYVSNTSKTFQVRYHVQGAVRLYDDRDELQWFAIPQDASAPINSSRVQVTLPEGTDANGLNITSSNSSAQVTKQGNTLTWTADSGLSNGLEIGVKIPKGVLQATMPSWQPGVDAWERTQPLINVALLLLGLLALVGGVLWSIMRWYRHGRDRPVKLHSDYITEPPSKLPPGLVGTLLDESADVRDVIATVVDQGRKGNLTMQETESGGIAGLFKSKDFQYAQVGNKVDYRFEEMVLNAIFKHGNPVLLSDLKNTFYSDLQPIYDEMYRSVVALKYFPESPKAVRMRNIAGGVFFFLLAGALAFVAIMFGDTISPFLWLFPVAFGAVGLVRLITAGIMPRKTDFGAQEAEKWRAFGRYLEQMQRYTDVQAAAEKFQLYLPYAVALGIERQFINHFNQVPAAMPPWYAPYGYGPVFYPYPVGTHTGGDMAPGPGGAMPQFNPGDAMQGMSNSLAGAMQGMSDSFTSMVNSASSALTSQPSSSGSSGSSGGWGGGGGGFGGGGGGGGSAGAD